MKSKKLFPCFVAAAISLASMLAPTKPAQAQLSSLLSAIPYAGPYISAGIGLATGAIRARDMLGAIPYAGEYIYTGIGVATGEISPLEAVTSIVGGSVGGVAGSVLGYVRSGIGTARYLGVIGSGYGLSYGETVQRQWYFRDDQGNEEAIDAKEWKLSYTDGEAKFVLVLADGREKEYPVEGLYHEEDLKYLCQYILKKLGEEIPQDETADSQNHGVEIQEMKTRLDAIAGQEDREKAATELKVFFAYLNDELCSVSIGMMKIVAGTEAGEQMTLTIRGERYTFRWCPAGSFTRTTFVETTDYETTRDRYGRTVRRQVRKMVPGAKQQVALSRGFWILDSEVTRQKYDRVVKMRVGSNLPYPQQPAAGITWNNADDFCKELQTITEKSFRLPTEAEWEYACLAGSPNEETDPAEISEVAWYAENSRSSETPDYNGHNNRYYRYNNRYGRRVGNTTVAHDVKGKKANAWGLYDMQGNVWEWCSDWYGEYGNTDTTDPQGPAAGQFRVARGGSYMSNAEECQPGYRYRQAPRYQTAFGLRVVLTPDAGETGDVASMNISDRNLITVNAANVNAPEAAPSPEAGQTDAPEVSDAAEGENTAGFTEVDETEENPVASENTSEGNADEAAEAGRTDASEVSDAAEDENTAGFTEVDETEENPAAPENTSEENTDETAESGQADDQNVNETEGEAETAPSENDESDAPSFTNPEDREEILGLIQESEENSEEAAGEDSDQ